jgi:hypothetical protein
MSIKTALAILCLVVVEICQPIKADDDTKQAASEQYLTSQTVHIDGKVQTLSGIETLILEPADYQTEFTAYGNALNIQALINLHHRYQLTQNERSSANAKYLHSEQNINRQQSLFRNGVASKRSLQGQQLQLQVDKASADAAQVHGKALIDEALLTWGKELAGWAFSDRPDQLDGFISGQQTLLKITLPVNRHLADRIQTIYVEPSGDRSKAVKATLIGTAPQADNSIQGASYFFKTSDTTIKPGMRVAVWVPEQSNNQTGVIIPKSALIWHLDQSFVYIKRDEQTFSRHRIDQFTLLPNGYFIANGQLKPGERLVTTGGQLLLSEEFRVQIPDEDND